MVRHLAVRSMGGLVNVCWKWIWIVAALVGAADPLFGQNDSIKLGKLEARLRMMEMRIAADAARLEQYEKQTFYLYQSLEDHDSTAPEVKFGGYAEGYYAWYRDSTGTEFQKFPTSAPRDQQFGLNMLYLSAQYCGAKARGNLGLQFGDIPRSSWDPTFNMIQEANFGVKLHRRLWLDAGFFRTHIGVESIQSRENITTSLAVTTYFEPYFLSGAKLTYLASENLSLQLNAFNGFNNYIENNRNKAVGASAVLVFNPQSAITFNTIFCDESPQDLGYHKRRLYNDIYYVHRGEKLEFGAEANFGFQTHSKLGDSTAMAFIYSALVVAKYKIGRFGIYGRMELFQDSDEILTGPLENPNHQLIGINLVGGTAGLEIKPLANTFLRLESRYIHTTDPENIFYWKGTYYHYRLETIAAMGVWF